LAVGMDKIRVHGSIVRASTRQYSIANSIVLYFVPAKCCPVAAYEHRGDTKHCKEIEKIW